MTIHTSKYGDVMMFKKAQILLQYLHSTTICRTQQSFYEVCSGNHRNKAQRLYSSTQCLVVVTGHSDKMLSVGTYMNVDNCARKERMRQNAVVPLELVVDTVTRLQ